MENRNVHSVMWHLIFVRRPFLREAVFIGVKKRGRSGSEEADAGYYRIRGFRFTERGSPPGLLRYGECRAGSAYRKPNRPIAN